MCSSSLSGFLSVVQIRTRSYLLVCRSLCVPETAQQRRARKLKKTLQFGAIGLLVGCGKGKSTELL